MGPSPLAVPVGLCLGFIADRLFGDPRRGHPVAAFGRGASRLELLMYDDCRAAGTAYALLLVGGSTLAAVTLEMTLRDRPRARTLAIACVTWAVLGGRSLERAAAHVARPLERDDLDGARSGLPSLVSRDPAGLDAPAVARATVESVAENTSDAVTAPLLWGAVAGLPGLVGYRAANTLDAMVGYRSVRFARFGWAAARLDDVLNLVPARLAALLALVCAPVVGGSARAGWRAMRRDAPAHPSPNGGVVEAAFAGVLGVSLGGINSYGGRREDRGRLGEGTAPRAADIDRATRLARHVSVGSLVVACALSAVRPNVAALVKRSWRRSRSGT
ncbi:MAG: cobalamin biosynthesis protein [Dermatophilaceae bacterium]